jgi:hypothetical protein
MPANFRRLSAIDQAELGIEQAIAKREWAGLLPSYKTLSQLLGFSVPTIALAAARLSERGVLEAAGARRRFRIAPGKARRRRVDVGTRKDESDRRLLILSPSPESTWDDNQRRVVLETMASALEDGWGCAKDTDDFLRAREPLKRWDKLLLRHRPTHLLAIQGTRALLDWAKANRLKVAFIGGQSLKPSEGVSLGVHLGPLLRHACRELAGLGHRRLLFPHWGELTAVADAAAGILGEELGVDPARLLADGAVFAAPPGKPREHRERLLRHMDKAKPTALVLVDWRDFLVAWDCLRERGLRAPRDLSLVVLNPGAETEWFSPLPAHYRIPQGHFAAEVREWLHGRPAGAETMTRTVLAAWNKGETLGQARKD